MNNKLPSIKETIALHGLNSKKALGQHFLLDTNITDRMVRFVKDIKNSAIIEIGPGPGALTRSLLMAGAPRVIAVEYDTRAIPVLAELQQHFPDQLTYLHADATRLNFAELLATLPPGMPVRVVSNLPYNVGTELLLQWLAPALLPQFAQIVVMLQKEVVERISAAPNQKSFGRLSILCQWLCKVENCFSLPPEAFSPPPKVDSGVVSLTARTSPLIVTDRALLEKLTQQLFSSRRKTLRNGLRHLVAAERLSELDIDLQRRPETLTIEEFCALANQIDRQNKA